LARKAYHEVGYGSAGEVEILVRHFNQLLVCFPDVLNAEQQQLNRDIIWVFRDISELPDSSRETLRKKKAVSEWFNAFVERRNALLERKSSVIGYDRIIRMFKTPLAVGGLAANDTDPNPSDKPRDDAGERQVELLYPNGRKYQSYTVDNGIPNGEFKQWYMSGRIEQEGTYKHGRKDGHWTYWHDLEGVKESEGDYLGDKKNGTWRGWDTKNRRSYEHSYKNGIYGGKSKKWQGEHLIEDGKYENGTREGVWTFFFANNGEVMSFGEFKNGERQGEWTFWRPDGGKRAKIEFKDGIRHGKYEGYSRNGNIVVLGTYVYCLREGKWQYYKDDKGFNLMYSRSYEIGQEVTR
jgi:antitoxin component YwqK of YwqJK toxin-antitoxin module